MKKVLNWTVGSFFRTIGRTIAFLVMGGLIYYLLTYNGIGIKDLFFDNVKASTWQQGLVNWQDSNGNTLPQYYGQYMEFNYNTNYTEKFYKIENGITPPSGAKGVLFSVVFRQFQFQPYLECYQYCSTSSCAGMCEKYTFNGHQNISFSMSYNNGNSVFNCYWYDNTFTTTLDSNYVRGLLYCPLGTTTGKITRVNYMGNVSRQSNVSATDYPTYSIGIEKTILFDVDGESAIIDNQNQNTQDIIDNQNQNHEEMMDSNTTEAEDEASSFFDDFEAPDIGGLSGIVTAPLNTIRSLLNSTCTNLQLPLPYVNKTLTLPCMNSIYTEHFGAFFTIYQTIILAIIAYRCIRSIFFDIHGFTNPSDDRIEVMDL